ncbi:unnamed protein product, partial [Prorocentrum cordatum]
VPVALGLQRCSGYNLSRRFVETGSVALEGDLQFRVLSWNVLAQDYIVWAGVPAGAKAAYSWRARRPLLLAQVARLDPDIFALQELEVSVFRNEVKPWAKSIGFDGYFAGAPVGISLFWRLSTFRSVTAVHADVGGFSFPWRFSSSKLTLSEDQFRRYIDRPFRTALFVTLVPTHARRHALVVSTTHLDPAVHANPVNLDVQVFQAERVMEALTDIVAATGARTDEYDSVSALLGVGGLQRAAALPALHGAGAAVQDQARRDAAWWAQRRLWSGTRAAGAGAEPGVRAACHRPPLALLCGPAVHGPPGGRAPAVAAAGGPAECPVGARAPQRAHGGAGGGAPDLPGRDETLDYVLYWPGRDGGRGASSGRRRPERGARPRAAPRCGAPGAR